MSVKTKRFRGSDLRAVSASEWTPQSRCPLCAGPQCPTDQGFIRCLSCAETFNVSTDETHEHLMARRARHLLADGLKP